MRPIPSIHRWWRASAVLIPLLSISLVASGSAGAVPVIVAAGDIACRRPCDAQRATARMIRRIDPRAVLTLGDNQYPRGALSDFRNSYRPTWGRFIRRTYPTPGNHDFHSGYFDYFGRRAHRATGGTYSFNLGRWHLVAINTGGRKPTGATLRWIRRDLARDRHRCELAYWHHPRWSSGHEHGSDERMAELWQVLYRAGVDVALNGHEHNYERFAKLAPSGRPARQGIRQFVVGTGGGADLYGVGSGIRGSQKRIDGRYGVLRMHLRQGGYVWRFVAIGGAVLDRGRSGCHR